MLKGVNEEQFQLGRERGIVEYNKNVPMNRSLATSERLWDIAERVTSQEKQTNDFRIGFLYGFRQAYGMYGGVIAKLSQ